MQNLIEGELYQGVLNNHMYKDKTALFKFLRPVTESYGLSCLGEFEVMEAEGFVEGSMGVGSVVHPSSTCWELFAVNICLENK